MKGIIMKIHDSALVRWENNWYSSSSKFMIVLKILQKKSQKNKNPEKFKNFKKSKWFQVLLMIDHPKFPSLYIFFFLIVVIFDGVRILEGLSSIEKWSKNCQKFC